MSTATSLPRGPLLTFYGDDFTGSSAAMEVTAFAGLSTVLFLNPPKTEQLAQFADHRVIGIAGIARSQSPEWMDRNLPPVFELLRSLGAPITHYKVCSTFDSAPHVGSIGRAIDLATPILSGAWHPVVVGDPGMGRYQAFGYLFAVANGIGYPLNEHPVMSRHPITPMDDANIGRHLARQTAKKIGLIDFVAIKRRQADARLASALSAGTEIVFLDVLDQQTFVEAGRLIWENRGERLFGIGSQGFEAALVAYWRSIGLIPTEPRVFRTSPASRIACVSGSVSPITAAQIAFAAEHGFAPIRLNATRAIDQSSWENECAGAVERALAALGEGHDPLVFTASGPDDPAVQALRAAIAAAGVPAEAVNDRIGAGLGWILDKVLRESRLTRAVISGGDSSSHAASVLGIYALSAVAPIAPGSPLCRAHASDPALAGLEIALKGGQVGQPEFFCAVKRGGMDG
ncbi:MAG: four-carbon acid sugar kinase family protein [Acetobacteraceae bacterium]|nr:four-carbon acid sugar kinase family protein [Acetobacteraceae bacterium]